MRVRVRGVCIHVLLCDWVGFLDIDVISGRWQAPAAVLPPEGWQRGRGPEGPEDKGTATRGPEGPESGQNMRVRGPEGPEDEQS